MSEEAVQTAMKRREGKGKGGKKRYTNLKTEFQIIGEMQSVIRINIFNFI